MKPRAGSKVTGAITVDRADGTIVLTVTNLQKGRATTVYLTLRDAKRLAKTLAIYAGASS